MERKKIYNEVLIDSYEEVENLELSKIAQGEQGKLNGLIVRGYEMKFNGGTNENGERYAEGAFSDFINRYFVEKKINIPLTLMHGRTFNDLVGRVLCCEVNSVGLYFVAYIPKGIKDYEAIKTAIKEGLIQGLSKEGWATDYDYNDKGEMIINKFDLLCVSLVDCPANGVIFEKTQEVKDATQFIDRREKTKNDIDDFFN